VTAACQAHDTDPAPGPGGNGHDNGLPCATHQAELVETRGVLKELRELTRAISRQLGDEIAARAARDAEIEKAILELIAAIGVSPDPIAGTQGSGLKGAVCVALNHSLRENARHVHPSLVNDEESEITSVMDRKTLVVERRLAMARARKIEIGAWTGGAVVVIGAVAAAVVEVIKMLGG